MKRQIDAEPTPLAALWSLLVSSAIPPSRDTDPTTADPKPYRTARAQAMHVPGHRFQAPCGIRVSMPRLRCRFEDFEVEEVPLYAPCGEGEHTFLWIEKRGIDT